MRNIRPQQEQTSMKAKLALTRAARDILQLMWLSEMNEWKPERRHPEDNSGECAEMQTAEMGEEEFSKVVQNPFIAYADRETT